MKVYEAIADIRSLVTGSLIGEFSVLSDPYNPAVDSSIHLRYPKKALAIGSVVCAGMNTLSVLGVSGDGATIEVLPGVDGGPQVPVADGELVFVRPALTTWAAFRELGNEIQGLTSRYYGLYWVQTVDVTSLNRQSGMYPLDPRSDGLVPFGLVKSEYRFTGTTAWQSFTDAEYQPVGNAIRVFQDPPGATEYRFTLALPYGVPTGDLSQDLTDLGITDSIANIPVLGAAATMAIGWQGRRIQPLAQGDSRRAAENSPQSYSGLSQELSRRQAQNINEEVSRLIALYGYRMPDLSGQTSYGRYGTYGSWR